MKFNIVCVIFIIILGFVLYANSINGSFLWDDEALIADNVYIRDWNHIPQIFTQSIGQGAGKFSRSYRPLQVFSYLIDFSLWKTDIRGYHLTNIILHIMVVLGLFWLISILFKDSLLAFIASILYMAHPIHPEAIAYISGRADPLASIFMLLSFILYIKSINSKNIIVLVSMAFSFALALLSRESSLIFPVLILAYHLSFKRKLALKEFSLIAGAAFLYIAVRLTALSYMFSKMPSSAPLLKRIPGFFVAITSYMRLLIFPFGLHMEYGAKVFSMLNLKAISGLSILVFLIIYALKKRRDNTLISFSILWFLAALLPSSNIYPVNAYMAEHWLYLPSMGFFLAAAYFLNKFYRKNEFKVLSVLIITGLLIFYSFLTIKQNTYWREPIPFYERTLKYSPDSPKVYYNLANTYKAAGRFDEAIDYYKKSIEIEPEFFDSHNNLGNVYNLIRKYQLSIESYKRAIEINPDFADAHNNLGIVYNIIGKNQEALDCYKRAIEINPKYAIAYNGMGILYALKGEHEEAIKYYKKSVEIDPGYSNAYNNLGTMYHRMGRREEAISSYRKAIDINPDGAEAYCNLAEVYAGMGMHKEAIGLCEESIEKNPDNAKAYYNIANSYSALERYEEAVGFYKKSLEKRPDNPYAYNNMGMAYNDMGSINEAAAAYKKAIEIKPDYVYPYNNLGMVYYNMDRYDEAEESFKKAIELQPEYAAAYFNLSLTYYKKGSYEPALSCCDKAISLGHKPDPEFLKLLRSPRQNTP
ncbi:MAG: tetratricopeptide repeat protein [Candidatus Omnitrophota bacterium]